MIIIFVKGNQLRGHDRANTTKAMGIERNRFTVRRPMGSGGCRNSALFQALQTFRGCIKPKSRNYRVYILRTSLLSLSTPRAARSPNLDFERRKIIQSCPRHPLKRGRGGSGFVTINPGDAGCMSFIIDARPRTGKGSNDEARACCGERAPGYFMLDARAPNSGFLARRRCAAAPG